MGGIWVQLLGGQVVEVRVVVFSRGCVWSAPVVSLILPVFDDTGSLGSPPRRVDYLPVSMVPHW